MFWRKKKKEELNLEGEIKLKPLKYHPKILIGWAEAIGGNKDLLEWFLASPEFKELGIFVYALHLKPDAREWLLKNGYAHLMAMINGVEGNQVALQWLEKNNFHVLKHVALSGDGNAESFKWLIDNGHQEFAMISKKIEQIKNDIKESHNDVHKFGLD
ncbi:MAG: hypothetical protein IPG07_15850 [Crocinitomicaceae bacterium]|nr:hypothetical protein [Crocinitomicaceae bacterium]